MSEPRMKKMNLNDETEQDLINELPDFILTTILSRLPIKESVKSRSVSTRWDELWSRSPLVINHFDFQDEVSFTNAMDKILEKHKGPIGSCLLSDYIAEPNNIYRWIHILAHIGIQDLFLAFHRAPFIIFECLLQCRSLRRLIFFECHNIPFLPNSKFVNLRELALRRVYMTEESILDILSGCHRLEGFAMDNCWGLQRIRITSSSLRCLILWFAIEIEIVDILVDGAPNLERLTLSVNLTMFSTIKVLNVPKLRKIGYVNADVNILQLEHVTLGRSIQKSLSLIHSLRMLSVEVDLSDHLQLDMVFALLKCFPCLERLDVKLITSSESKEHQQFCEDIKDGIDCLENSLTIVNLRGFRGLPSEIWFARFLIAKAQVLKVLTSFCPENWMATWLCVKDKASPYAKVAFKRDHYNSYEFSSWDEVFTL